MPSPSQPEPKPAAPHPVVEHVSGAHERLKILREKIGEHPELTEAIRSLEMALSILTVKTGGMF
jgi:hypothetical protein